MTFPRGTAMLAPELNHPALRSRWAIIPRGLAHLGGYRTSTHPENPLNALYPCRSTSRGSCGTRSRAADSAERRAACGVAQQHSAAVVSDSRNDLEHGPGPRGEELVVGTVIRVAGETVLALEVARTAGVQVGFAAGVLASRQVVGAAFEEVRSDAIRADPSHVSVQIAQTVFIVVMIGARQLARDFE